MSNIKDDIKDICNNNKDKLTDSGVKTFFEWITNHKIYTIVLLIFITSGFSKIVKHFNKHKEVK